MKYSRECNLTRVDVLPSKYEEAKKEQESRGHMTENECNDRPLGNECVIGKNKENQGGRGQSKDWRS